MKGILKRNAFLIFRVQYSNMKKLFPFIILLFSISVYSQKITTRFEQSGGKQSPAYFEIVDWWKKLDQISNKVKMLTMGPSDAGFPLNLVMVSNDGDYNFQSIHKKNRKIIFIINGIHPGEPDGIDASMLMVRDIVINKYKIPDDIVLAIIPVYNIGGCLNRSPYYRIDQNGPEEKGFRGNSQNLDLNRDFIKSDSKEARSFAEIFHLLDPIVFIDNHVSDGADYQHVMTLLVSQHNKLGGAMGEYMNKEFEPGIYALMKQKGYDLVPYVNAFGDTPETGWSEYWDSPRYSSGYATLWHTFAFVPESHMLKPYDQRVKATYAIMQCFIAFTEKNGEKMKALKQQTIQAEKAQAEFPVSWTLDKSQFATITYKGYAAEKKLSDVSGLPRLYYDRNKSFEKQVPFYNYYKVTNTLQKPTAYVIPQGWWKVIDLLKLNKVQMIPLQKDTAIVVLVYHIDDYKSSPRQYENHHLNNNVKIAVSKQKMNFRKGDYYIPMNQDANRFLIETLEPQAEDSYFVWNFFDAILGQKEGFAGYSFEDIAAEYLKKNPELKAKLDERRASDSSFAKSANAQLNFVFQNSPYFEPVSNRYPVFRIVE